jgi:hypothetical protein
MHGVTPETAWYMLHRLREAMKREPLFDMLRGTIAVDETWIGGDPKNRHDKPAPDTMTKLEPGYKKARTNKTAVFSLVNKETGEGHRTLWGTLPST